MPIDSPPRTRLPAAERRAAIVQAAVELFSRQGFRGTTTRQLAAAVGVSEPVLYRHFATKQALYDAILEVKTGEVPVGTGEELAGYSEAGDDRAFFTRLAELLLDWYLRDPRYARLLMFSALERHELAARFYERHVVAFYELITGHIERQIERGRMRREDPLLAARLFVGMVAHQGLIYAVHCPGQLAGGREAVVRTVVDILLKGMTS